VPVLSNPRHELFTQVLAAGCSATEAYVKAGYRLNKGNAGRLKANERIRKRVEELQARNVQAQEAAVKANERIRKRVEELQARNVQAQEAAVGVTIEQLRAQLAEAYEIAKELSQPTAMVAATTAQAKLAGLGSSAVSRRASSQAKCLMPRSCHSKGEPELTQTGIATCLCHIRATDSPELPCGRCYTAPCLTVLARPPWIYAVQPVERPRKLQDRRQGGAHLE
jgi:hypothetical protein